MPVGLFVVMPIYPIIEFEFCGGRGEGSIRTHSRQDESNESIDPTSTVVLCDFFFTDILLLAVCAPLAEKKRQLDWTRFWCNDAHVGFVDTFWKLLVALDVVLLLAAFEAASHDSVDSLPLLSLCHSSSSSSQQKHERGDEQTKVTNTPRPANEKLPGTHRAGRIATLLTC
jgi:hypothetical protein